MRVSDPPPAALQDVALEPALRWLLSGLTLALAWVLQPFAGPILWGAIVALFFAPWNRWLLPRLGRRRSLAAGLTLALVTVLVVLPLLLLLAGLGREAAMLYERLQSNDLKPTQYFREIFAALPRWARDLLDRFGLFNFSALQRWLNTLLLQGSRMLGAQGFGIGQNAFDFVHSVCIAPYLAFFLSLLPAVGAALVWAPVAIYFLVAGTVWQGWALVIWGVLVIGLADNLLRPMLVGRDTRLPDWLVLLCTLGGLAVMGFNGFVLGSAVAAMFMAAWHIHLARAADD